MMTNPYRSLPSYTRWSRAVAGVSPEAVHPAVNFPFRLTPNDLVATAGSCFAQHIANRLQTSGFNYFVSERGSALAAPEISKTYNYGVFSARYANVYTTRQLRQLLERAYGKRQPAEDYWTTPDGAFLDPLRPTIEPAGFSSLSALHADRESHLTAVRAMFEGLDYFVFTLGLTEAWVDVVDGTVLPVCPGVAGGTFNPERHKFVNFGISDVMADLRASIEAILAVNPKARFILTVSPVPLIATAEDEHALVATTYSKSVLRVACTEMVNAFPDRVAYFASYEIITGAFNRGRYFAEDLRSVTAEGVEHVMRVFMTTATGDTVQPAPAPAADPLAELHALQKAQQVVCEEELLEIALTQQTQNPG